MSEASGMPLKFWRKQMNDEKAAPMREDVTQADEDAFQDWYCGCASVVLSDVEGDALRDAFRRHRLAHPASVKWLERWHGSEPQKGSAIVDERGNLIAYFGGDEVTHKATTAIVAAHNAAFAHTARPVAGDEDVERVARAISPIWWAWFDAHGDLSIAPDAHAHTLELEAAKRAIAAMREGVGRGMVQVPVEVVAFLKGAGPLNGHWFGDPKPEDERGNFWWRKHLPTNEAVRNAIAALSPEQPR
jgi:hypothetical protein